jgi:hypothetical protein
MHRCNTQPKDKNIIKPLVFIDILSPQTETLELSQSYIEMITIYSIGSFFRIRISAYFIKRISVTNRQAREHLKNNKTNRQVREHLKNNNISLGDGTSPTHAKRYGYQNKILYYL